MAGSSEPSARKWFPGPWKGGSLDEDGTLRCRGCLVLLFRAGSEAVAAGAESDDLGYYHVEPVLPASYVLEVSRLGFETETRQLEVARRSTSRSGLFPSDRSVAVGGDLR